MSVSLAEAGSPSEPLAGGRGQVVTASQGQQDTTSKSIFLLLFPIPHSLHLPPTCYIFLNSKVNSLGPAVSPGGAQQPGAAPKQRCWLRSFCCCQQQGMLRVPHAAMPGVLSPGQAAVAGGGTGRQAGGQGGF